MNAWNHDFVHSLSAKQIPGFITNIDGRVRLQPPVVANHYRKLTAESASSPNHTKLQKSTESAKTEIVEAKAPPFPHMKRCFGYGVQWLSELDQTELLDCLLAYADEELTPTSKSGGLYYPRNNVPFVFSEEEGYRRCKEDQYLSVLR